MKKLFEFILSAKAYDALKWVLMKFVPPFIFFISSLGQIYGFGTDKIVLTISAIATFIAGLIGISTINYNKSK